MGYFWDRLEYLAANVLDTFLNRKPLAVLMPAPPCIKENQAGRCSDERAANAERVKP